MLKPTLLKLRDFLLAHTILRGSRGVDIEEKLGIFLYIVSKGASQSDASEFFDRLKATISICFDQVLRAMVILHAHEVQLPGPDNPEGFQRIQQSKKYFPFFKGCIGAIDGTHIYISLSERGKGDTILKSQRRKDAKRPCCMYFRPPALLRFSWLALTTQDSYKTLSTRNVFSIPPGKFYLADAGYSCRWPFLVPYHGIRYHLREQNLSNLRSQNKEEPSNLRHSSLRNAIE
jgi:hypothetical protein